MLAVLTVALALQQSVADTSPFRPLALPAATTTRSASGAPGPRYWQQRADYTLQATLDTATSVLRGSGRIYYVNRSPETLDFVWVQLDQNLFAPGSIAAILNQPPLRFAGGGVFDFSGKGFVGGVTNDTTGEDTAEIQAQSKIAIPLFLGKKKKTHSVNTPTPAP